MSQTLVYSKQKTHRAKFLSKVFDVYDSVTQHRSHNRKETIVKSILLQSLTMQALLFAGAGAIIGWAGFGAALASAN